MVVKRKQIKQDPFRLNEPVARIAGGSQRTSVVVRDRAFANIRVRERLYGVLLRQAAAAGLRALAHRVGPAILRVLLENERDDETRVALDRILQALSEQPAKRRARSQTASRNRSRGAE